MTRERLVNKAIEEIKSLESQCGSWQLAGMTLRSRLIAPVAFHGLNVCMKCADPAVAREIIINSGTQFLIVSPPSAMIAEDFDALERSASVQELEDLFATLEREYIVLNNTARSTSAEEAITRAMEGTRLTLVKLEVFEPLEVDSEETLMPVDREVLRATRELRQLDFQVIPFITDNCGLIEEMIDLGVSGIRVYTGYIGLKRGLRENNRLEEFIRQVENRVPVIGEGGMTPEAAFAFMAKGGDVVLANETVLDAVDPAQMVLDIRKSGALGRLEHLKKK